MISGSSQTGFTVPWVSLFLQERWSLTSGSKTHLRDYLMSETTSLLKIMTPMVQSLRWVLLCHGCHYFYMRGGL